MRINRRALAARNVAMVNDGITPRNAADVRFETFVLNREAAAYGISRGVCRALDFSIHH